MLTGLPEQTTAAVLMTNPAAYQASGPAYSAFGALGGAGLLGLGFAGLGGLGADTTAGASAVAIGDALASIERELRTGLLPLLQHSALIALGPLPGGASSRSDLSLMLVADVTAPGNAEVPLQHARNALRKAGLTSEVAIRGGRVYAATGSAYVEGLGEPGHLGDGALFREAMGPLGDGLRIAAYVDIASIVRYQVDVPSGLRPLRAVGITSATDGSITTMRLRAVIG
jgi:hypothetical protein